MSHRYLPSMKNEVPKFGLSLKEFAEQEGKTLGQINYLLRKGRIFGATQVNREWRVGPPAKILNP